MKAKNQQNFTSDADAKEKLIVYVYEYLIHSNAKQAADMFKDAIQYNKDIKITDGPGFLVDWWCVFWDLYCAAPERRHTQPESSNDARAFHDLMRSTPMSPSITQPSPPQHSQQPPPPPFIGGPRYGLPQVQPRVPPPRMQNLPHGGGPHGGPPAFIPAGSPRYPHGPPPQPHMNQGPMFPGPDQMGSSPGMNRMTPVGGPPPQQVVAPPPPGGPHSMQMVGMPGQQIGGPVQAGGPPRNGSQGQVGGWQTDANYTVHSPANQPCYSGPGSNMSNQGGPMMMGDGSMMEVKSSPLNTGEPSTPHSEEYVMPVRFGQETSECEAEIYKIKQSMQEDTTKMFEKEHSEYLEYS